MPVMLDEDTTMIEIVGDRLVILPVEPAEPAGPSESARPSVPVRRTVVTATATSVTRTDVDDRFAERRAAAALDGYNAKRRRRFRAMSAVMVSVGAVLVVFASPLFRVQHVDVIGLKGLSRETLLHDVLLDDQPSMLTLKTVEVEAQLKKVPLVHTVNVWKSWPNHLVIEVSERFAVATVRSTQGWDVLDQLGEPIESRPVRPDLPQIDLTGRPLNSADPAIIGLLRVASASSPRLRQQLDRLSSGPEGVSLSLRAGVLSNRDLRVRIGQADDLQAKLRALETMLDPDAKPKLRGFAILDLSVADQPALMPPTTSVNTENTDQIGTQQQTQKPTGKPELTVDATDQALPGSNLTQ
jgi:cell division protein FtsQ